MSKEIEIEIQFGGVPTGTIVAFGGSNANIPAGWLLCDGSGINSKYKDLIALLGSNTTPNLSGRTLIGVGKTAHGSNYTLHQTGGEEQHQLTISEIPQHSHSIGLPQGDKSWSNGSGNTLWGGGSSAKFTSSDAGGNHPHNNMQPYFAVNYIIFAGSKD